MKRDVEAFKVLLRAWYNAERHQRSVAHGNGFDWEAPEMKAAEAAADQALAAVLAAFTGEDAVPPSPLPPQNSRDSDFP